MFLTNTIKKIESWWIKKFNVHVCEKCGSWDTHYSYGRWARGWNDLCGQAYGDSGARCNKCIHITWDKSIEKHLETLPKWCTPYEVKR